MPRPLPRLLCPALLVLSCAMAAGQERRELEPEEVRRAVEEVFADPSLRRGLETTHLSLDDLARLFELQVQRLFDAVMGLFKAIYQTSPALYYLLIALLLAVLCLLLWHMSYTVRRAFQGLGGGEEQEERHDQAGRERRYRELRAEAESQASAGQRREAVRTLLLALLALLHEEQVLRVARSWTPREVLARLEDHGGGPARLAAFGAAVEAAAYGSQAVSAQQLADCQQALGRLERELRSGDGRS